MRDNPSQSNTGALEPVSSADMVIHTRARDLLEWLLPRLAQCPREHRHGVARHMAELVMRLHDVLVAARHVSANERAGLLLEADITLDQLRQYLHLAWRWHWLSEGQWAHVSELTGHIGRLLGGWRRR